MVASPWSCQRLTAVSCRWWGISPQRCLLAATSACAPPWSPRTSRRKKAPRSPHEGSVQTHKHIRCWVARRAHTTQNNPERSSGSLPGCHERRRRCPPQSTSQTFLWDDTGWVRFGVLRARQTKASPHWITNKHFVCEGRAIFSSASERAHYSVYFVTGWLYYAWSSWEKWTVSYPEVAPLPSLWRGRRWCTVWWT